MDVALAKDRAFKVGINELRSDDAGLSKVR